MCIELLTAPRTVFQRNRRGILLRVAPKGTIAAISRFIDTRPLVARPAHTIRRGRRANPQANLERPIPKPLIAAGISFLAFQFKSTNECRRATQLVECE